VNEVLVPMPAAEPGASFELTIWVEDADAVCAELTERGVSMISGPLDRLWGCARPRFSTPTATFGRCRPTSSHSGRSGDIPARLPRRRCGLPVSATGEI